MKRRTLRAALLFLAVFSASAQTADLVVAAAANLSGLENHLVQEFVQDQGRAIDIDFVFASSGTLTNQILQGAPFDLFLAADMNFPQAVYEAGRALAPPAVYARGVLVVFSRQKRNFSSGLAVLTGPEFVHVAIANPETAPYGRAAIQAIKAAGLLPALQNRLVVGQSVSQALQFGLTAAEAAFVNKSALFAPEMRAYTGAYIIEENFWMAVDPTLHEALDQGAVVLVPPSVSRQPARAALAGFGQSRSSGAEAAGAERMALAGSFLDFLLSENGRRIFLANGYEVP